MSFSLHNIDRRVAARFPIERDIRYKLLAANGGNEEGTGKSINISSAGILFTADRLLPPGSYIEITVSWPVLLTTDLHMRLVALGRVVRSEEGTAAMEISRYEFRNVQADALSSQF